MCRRSVLLVSLGLWVTMVASSSAQQTSGGNGRSLAARQRWARFVIMRGRITVVAPRGQTATLATGDSEDPEQELFALHSQSGSATVRFEQRTATSLLQISFSAPQELMIERVQQEPTAERHLTLVQAPSGLTLTLLDSDGEHQMNAPTLWHLLLVSPMARAELIPVLEQLRPDWQLAAQVQRLEQQLLGARRGQPRPPIEQLVEQLGDTRFAVRHAADRQLRAIGHGLLPMLSDIDASRLNAEQRRRLAEIHEELQSATEDTTSQTAVWLANDRRLWNTWQHSSEPLVRSAAEYHLAWLSEQPLPRVRLAKAPSSIVARPE